jgi:ATP-binding cassette subfamily B protein
LSAIAKADAILIMENGTIIESRNHQDLLLQKGRYFDLLNKQVLL